MTKHHAQKLQIAATNNKRRCKCVPKNTVPIYTDCFFNLAKTIFTDVSVIGFSLFYLSKTPENHLPECKPGI